MRGTAVVTTRIGGLEEYIEHGKTGLLVPPGQPEALREAVSSLLGNPAHTESLGMRGREEARRYFSEERYVTRFEDLYMQIRDSHLPNRVGNHVKQS